MDPDQKGGGEKKFHLHQKSPLPSVHGKGGRIVFLHYILCSIPVYQPEGKRRKVNLSLELGGHGGISS